jgi:hypothetical protein
MDCVKLFSAAGHFMGNPRPMVFLQDPILVLGNICLCSPTEKSNLQGASVLAILFRYVTIHQIFNQTQSTNYKNTCFLTLKKQYLLPTEQICAFCMVLRI